MKLVFSAVLLLLCSSLQLVASYHARVCDPDTRNDCGYFGITEADCIGAGRDCCWKPGKEGEPWCFTKSGGTDVQCIASNPRYDCGFLGITQEQCEDRGCCYDDTKPKDQPHCYQQSELIPEGCFPDKPRTDCGEVGTDETECEKAGCCWSPANGLPWCFETTSITDDELCTAVIDRSECGIFGINQKECEDKGCCWEPDYGQPWCFHKYTTEPQCFPNKPREDCGELGTTQEQCEEKDCCWTPSDVSGQPWCYNKLDPVSDMVCMTDERKECGFLGITKKQCEDRGCCYDPAYGQPYCYDRNAGPLPPQPARVDAAAGRPVDEISDEELAAMIMEELVEEVREEMNAKSKGR